MKRAAAGLPFKFSISITVILLVIFLIIGYFMLALKNLEYFKVKDIIVKGADSADFSYLKGRNTFTIDLQREQSRISQLYPVYKKIRLIRVLPNRLFADFIKRSPVAFVKLYRYYCADDDAVLFDIPPELKQLELPIICGLDTKIFGAKAGRRYNIRELKLALEIIREFRASAGLRNYKIKTVDVSKSANALFFMVKESINVTTLAYQNTKLGQAENHRGVSRSDFLANEGLEVKLGENNIRQKLGILGSLIMQAGDEGAKIKYIDLRFKEPVIKLKDAK